MGAEWRSGGWTAAAVRPALAPRRPGTTQILRNENQSRPMPGPACGVPAGRLRARGPG
jgi:hypothetical protein